MFSFFFFPLKVVIQMIHYQKGHKKDERGQQKMSDIILEINMSFEKKMLINVPILKKERERVH